MRIGTSVGASDTAAAEAVAWGVLALLTTLESEPVVVLQAAMTVINNSLKPHPSLSYIAFPL